MLKISNEGVTGMLAMLCETQGIGLSRLREIDPNRQVFRGHVVLSDGREVFLVPVSSPERLYGIEITGFWSAGEVPLELKRLAETRVRK